MKAALLALALVAQPAPRQQFDLICSGSGRTVERLRIDLVAKQWCLDEECRVRDIAEIHPDIIWLFRHDPTYRGDWKGYEYIDRTSGKWSKIVGPLDVEGTCQSAKFSGFPELPTKF